MTTFLLGYRDYLFSLIPLVLGALTGVAAFAGIDRLRRHKPAPRAAPPPGQAFIPVSRVGPMLDKAVADALGPHPVNADAVAVLAVLMYLHVVVAEGVSKEDMDFADRIADDLVVRNQGSGNATLQ